MKRRTIALLLSVVLCLGLIGTASALKIVEDPEGGTMIVPDDYPEPTPTPKPPAEWDYAPSGSSYTVGSSSGSSTGGSWTTDKSTASKGETVTITVKPNPGYITSVVTVMDKNGNFVKVVKNANGTYSFVMPDGNVIIDCSFVTPGQMFSDLDDNEWYRNAIAYVVNKGLMEGIGGGKFSPNSTTSRGMIVTILYRLEGSPATSQSTFSDVASGQWYTNAVAWAAANKIVEGYGNNTFGPNDDITREQMATIMYRYAVYKGYNVNGQADLSGYTDAGSINSWALTAMRWVNNERLITGRTATTLAPTGNTVRSEAAAILMRFCQGVAGME